MKYIEGKDRDQTALFCLNEAIGQDNEVRLIDLFVNSVNLGDFGFKTNHIDNGRPAYRPSDLLKLFLYGYLNRIRSSIALEKECTRNLEVMWLMPGLVQISSPQMADGITKPRSQFINLETKPHFLEHFRMPRTFKPLRSFLPPQITQKINQSKTQHQVDFKSGLLGNYFAQSMLPKEKLNKMKTFKDKNHINSSLDLTVIDTFVKQQHTLIDLLNRSKKVNLNKVKIATTLSRFLKLKLGDMFAFLINHNIRHFKQIERIQLAMTSQ